MIRQYWIYIGGIVILFAAFLWWLTDASYSDEAANIATIVGAIVAALGLGGIFWQLRINAQQSKLQRSYEFASTYHKPDYLPHIIRARKFFAEDRNIEDKWKEFNTDDEIRTSVGIMLSFFEEIGAMYNMGLVDKEVIHKLLKPPAIAYFDIAKEFIEKMREGRKDTDPPIYEQWENMYNLLKKED